MEVYTDDMLVKSNMADDRLNKLRHTFDVLEKYKMRLNMTKCTFRVLTGKFLGYLVT